MIYFYLSTYSSVDTQNISQNFVEHFFMVEQPEKYQGPSFHLHQICDDFFQLKLKSEIDCFLEIDFQHFNFYGTFLLPNLICSRFLTSFSLFFLRFHWLMMIDTNANTESQSKLFLENIQNNFLIVLTLKFIKIENKLGKLQKKTDIEQLELTDVIFKPALS